MSFAFPCSRLTGRTVLLIGSGWRAAAALPGRVDAGVRLRWFSPTVDCAEEILLAGEPGQVELMFRAPRARAISRRLSP
jgi:hypothetical protein